jgi:hypothetical protein
MNSAALIADGYHARTDGLTSLAVVLGAIGVWLGYPLADPIIGLLITIAILGIVWQSARAVMTRTLDGVEPGVTAEIRHAAEHVPGIASVTEARARWIGHRLHTDVAIAVDKGLSLAEALAIAARLKQELLDHIAALRTANISFDAPDLAPGAGNAAGGPSGHHHAPDSVPFGGVLAGGTLAIVDTPEGERMRAVLDRGAPGLRAKVTIDRPGGAPESFCLEPVAGRANLLQSLVAPAEPHDFTAILELTADERREALSFGMKEPAGHVH